eukprot:1254122-Pleurochrysis_carterae.AAC.2
MLVLFDQTACAAINRVSSTVAWKLHSEVCSEKDWHTVHTMRMPMMPLYVTAGWLASRACVSRQAADGAEAHVQASVAPRWPAR